MAERFQYEVVQCEFDYCTPLYLMYIMGLSLAIASSGCQTIHELSIGS